MGKFSPTNILNYCKHDVSFYPESAFSDLEQVSPTSWIAGGVDESQLLLRVESSGEARIAVETIDIPPIAGVPAVATKYGMLTGFPRRLEKDTVYLVSGPTLAMAKASEYPFASMMASPYKVVRLRGNSSKVLGCMGLSFQ